MISSFRASSRSVSNSIFYDRVQERDRKIHLQKLREIQGDKKDGVKNK